MPSQIGGESCGERNAHSLGVYSKSPGLGEGPGDGGVRSQKLLEEHQSKRLKPAKEGRMGRRGWKRERKDKEQAVRKSQERKSFADACAMHNGGSSGGVPIAVGSGTSPRHTECEPARVSNPMSHLVCVMVLAVRESRSVCQSCVYVCFSAQGHDAQSDAGEGRTPALPGRAVFKGHHASFTPCITLHISELGPENAICPPFLLKPPPAVEQQCEILWACGVVFRVRDGQDPRIPNFHPSVLKREEPRQGRPVPESQ